MVTGATMHKQHFFRGQQKLTILETELLRLTNVHNWDLEAWAVFSNHYHFIARSDPESNDLSKLLKQLHSETARAVNLLDGTAGRVVWFNFWESRVTYQRSYLARLKYVHQNPVKHRLVTVANQYEWCSAAWFERTASPAAVDTIYGLKIDRISVRDNY